MKRPAILMIFAVLIGLAATLSALGQDQKKDAPAATPAPAPAPGKHLPQAKTDAEFAAYKAAVSSVTPEAMEKAADDFSTNYPTSEIKILIYKQAMRTYQNANKPDKTLDMSRKTLSFDPDDPEALVNVAQLLAERTRSTDLDKDQKYAEAQKDAEKALQTVDTDLVVNPGTPQEQIDQYKAALRSNAYNAIGIMYLNKDTKEDYAKAEDNLRKSLAAMPAQPDPVTVLQLALALDKQDKYTDALTEANRAVEMTKEGNPVGDSARREQSRLKSLTANSIK